MWTRQWVLASRPDNATKLAEGATQQHPCRVAIGIIRAVTVILASQKSNSSKHRLWMRTNLVLNPAFAPYYL